MADVLYAVEIWVLVAALLVWFFARAAVVLRQPPPPLLEPSLPAEARRNAHEACAPDVEALCRAVRIYDRA